ncbi:MAG: hypothetical protein N2039_01630 [Gemmataceae bacterium]|nr:hypothetical protein [Gemmataceae bacterium]
MAIVLYRRRNRRVVRRREAIRGVDLSVYDGSQGKKLKKKKIAP